METKFEFTFENRSKKRQRDVNNQGQEYTSGRVKKEKSTRKQPRDDRRDSPRHSEVRSSRQERRGEWREIATSNVHADGNHGNQEIKENENNGR